MIFTLEALRARAGDSLLLHYGEPDDRRMILIDGGPGRVWEENLRPRLDALRQARLQALGVDEDDEDTDTALPIRMVMVSHIDDDHINGILDLMGLLIDERDAGRRLPFRIEELWHNSFDDLLGNRPDELAAASAPVVGTASTAAAVPEGTVRDHQGSLVLASVNQGRKLRGQAEKLGLAVNVSSLTGELVLARDTEVDLEQGLSFRIIGPSRERLRALQEKWDAYLVEKGLGQAAPVDAADFSDTSVFNLASIMVLAEAAGARMLLTGDALGSDVLDGLDEAGLMEADGTLHVDLFKLPHHGSDRNVAPVLFERVTADHYVVSGDGKHGNPEVETFRMLLEARRNGPPFHLHLTYGASELIHDYPIAELEALFEDHRAAGTPFTLHAPAADQPGLAIDLGDPLAAMPT